MKKSADFFAQNAAHRKTCVKKSRDFLKLHLTPSPEKLNSKRVINVYLHDFAQQVRSEEGVILHGN
jgi:hypothetical protein